MDTKRALFAGAFTLAAVAACGGKATGSGNSNGDVSTYKGLVASVQSAATTYNATMLGPTGADCQRNHDQYDAQVRPLVSQIVQMAGEMDDLISTHGGGSSADMKCGAAMLMDELDYHRSLVCTLSGLSANQGEVTRHADTMNSFADHLSGRCDEIRGASAGVTATANWTPMMSSCESWSTTCCSTMMRSGCCGGLMGKDGMTNGESCCGVGG